MSTTSTKTQKLWIKLIEDYRSSGTTAKIWCEQEGYKIHTLRYWIRKLNQQSSASNTGFIELVSPSSTNPAVEVTKNIQLSCDSYRLDIPVNYHEDTLIRLLATLKKC